VRSIFLILLLAVLAVAPPARAAEPDTLAASPPGALEFTPLSPEADSEEPPYHPDSAPVVESEWLSAPFGERLLTDPEAWRARRDRGPLHGYDSRLEPVIDYNRVDVWRIGLAGEIQDTSAMGPRIGGRYEYATGRRRALYGVQFEQPLLPPGRLALGVSMSRRTDHSELQQLDDCENSAALLFANQDFRDYFEREGLGAYLAWRVPEFSVVSVHLRRDTYRSLARQDGTRSFFARSRALRDNPPVAEGEIHALLLRLERQTRRTARTRAGFYHWVELEHAGHELGGDFAYTRALADLRSVVRLSPTASLALRAAGGSTLAGVLPAQKQFTAGGADGLRAHAFAEFRGGRLLLAQAEYTTALWRVRPRGFDAGLHAIAFVDAGRAWDEPGHAWRPSRQHLAVDGGLGLTTSEDNLRIYVARSLQRSRSRAVFSIRLQRPF
jgi:hypothetical protein